VTGSTGTERAPHHGVGAPAAAIAAVRLYRIATFYLPPLWGFPAMLWLRRNRYL
jgi:uncharacterized membrane protein YbhN (UPF0104 family)